MSQISEILEYNKQFVAKNKYEQYETGKFPNRKIAILSCMDTRLSELLPAALGLKNGDIKIIKNAGAIVTHPFGSVMRSLLIAIYQLDVEDIMVIGHDDCGMQSLQAHEIIAQMMSRGISEDTIKMVHYCGVDLTVWLKGFDCVLESVKNTTKIIREHPLIPKDVNVHSFVINPLTGALTCV